MKILVINWQDRKNPLSGGAETHLHEIFSRIAEKGNEVTLLCSSFNNAPKRETVDGINVIRIGKRYNFNFYVPYAIQKLVRKNNYDIVIDDINKIPFFTPLYIKEKPILVILHHFFGRSIYREAIFPSACYIDISERLVPFVYAKEVFSVVSESTKKELVKMGIPSEKIFVIHNAVSSNLHPDFSKKSSSPLVLIHGRVKKYKCPELCLYAMKRIISQVPEARLVVAGTGDYLPALIELSKKLKLENNVEFLGFVSEEKKKELLQSAWVSVNMSLKEGWGITVIESNACGTPVVASNSPGLRDSVVDNKTGFLVSPGDVEASAGRIIRILQNKALRDTLSQNALEWANKFNWGKSAEKMLKLIEKEILEK